MHAAETGFPRTARLLTPRAFQRVFAGADRIADRYFTLLVAENAEGFPRLGLAIGRRISTRAVDRNRIKRLARESFRHQQGDLPAVDIVLMARPVARTTDNGTLQKALGRLWQRVSQRCEPSSPAY